MARVKSTSGGKEEQVLSRAKELRHDPGLLLPQLTDDCPTMPFDRIRKDLEKVKEAAGDPEALQRLMSRGDDLAQAYAALLYFLEEKPDAMTVLAQYPTGTIPYLAIGRSSPEASIAVQYYRDPRRLLLGYLRLAKGGLLGGGGFHFYAMKEGIVCTGKVARPPEKFVMASVSRLPYRFSLRKEGEEKGMVCSHIEKGERLPHLNVTWEAAEMSFRLCRKCARDDTHLLGSLLENMAVPDPQRSFTLSVTYPLEHHHKGPCALSDMPGLSSGSERNYRRGRMSDTEVITGFIKETEEALHQVKGGHFVAGGHCYADDSKAFLDGIGPTPAEKVALQSVLPVVDYPLLIPEKTAGKALETLWKDHALMLIEAMGTKGEPAERLVSEFQSSPGRVSELIERLYRKNKEAAVLAELPEYADTVPEAAFAIEISRLYRTQGIGAVEQRLTSKLPEEGKVRGMAWGFLMATGRSGEQHEWRFSKTEMEFGEALSGAAKRLLHSTKEDYHGALSDLLSAAGVTAWGTKIR